MPAASGSPTQLKTSVATPQDLAGTPDDAFSDGDMAYVGSLYPLGTFQLVRVPGVVPVGAIPAFSGNGYWVPLQAYPQGPAGGDLYGTYPDPQVGGLEGFPLAAPPPINGDVLVFNGATSEWDHTSLTFGGGPPVGPAGGDLGGLYPDPIVVGLYTYPIANVVPALGDVLYWNGAAWEPTNAWEALDVACGSFSSSVTQYVAAADTETVCIYNTVEYAGDITLTNNGLGQATRITVAQDGLYEISASAQVSQHVGNPSTASVWAKLNGNNLPRSNSTISTGGVLKTNYPYVAFYVDMLAGQYLEFFFSADNANVHLEATPPQVAPVRPADPSIIVNAKKLRGPL